VTSLPRCTTGLLAEVSRVLSPHIRQTPCTRDDALGATIKWENRQVGRSFKIRGVLYEALLLPPKARERGLVTCTTGNHGLAVASAANIIGAPSTIFVPSIVEPYKIRQILDRGAQVCRVDGDLAAAERAARLQCSRDGSRYMSAANSDHFVYGLAALADEWLRQAPGMRCLFVPAGGGGLIRALSWALRELVPGPLEIWAVQSAASPYLYAYYYRGEHAGVHERETVADALQGAPEVDFPWPELTSICDGVILVQDDEIINAVEYAYRAHGEIVEGGGAAALAAALRRDKDVTGLSLLASGGNVSPDWHALAL
jgi:threonine dehydratase